MSLTRSLILRAARSKRLAEVFMRRPFARRAVRRFMPGEQLDDALAAAERLAAQKIRTIVCQLGESLTGDAGAEAVRDHYLGALNEIHRRGLPTEISVKPTQLGLDRSYDLCVSNLEVLAQRATENGSRLWIDMEDSSYVDRTLAIYRHLKLAYDPVGVCLQSYLYRTPADLESLLDLKPLIRLVKGAYSEPAEVAYPRKRDVDAQYLVLAEQMFAAASEGKLAPFFGTHDMKLVAQLHEVAKKSGVEPGAYEIQMLYGIRSAEQRTLAEGDQIVRCFICYGEKWFPWYMRRLAERPANVWFVVKSALGR